MSAFTLGKLPDLVDSVRPAVAHVEVRSDEGHSNGSGFAIPRRSDDTGSGGLIVTNYHVVAGASEVTVRLHDDSEHEATIRLLDESTDLALIGIDATPAHEYDILGDELDAHELLNALGEVSGAADHFDDEIIDQFGGKRFEDYVREAEDEGPVVET